MKVYLYNKDTLIFEYAKDAYLDPRSSELTGKEVYFKPAYATFTPLPELKKGQAAKYVPEKDGWEAVNSVVGKFVYNKNTAKIEQIRAERTIRPFEILLTAEECAAFVEAPDKYEVRDNKLVDISGSQSYQNKVNIEKYRNLIRAAKEEYDTFLNTPVNFKGNMYLPRYIDDYEKLQFRRFPQEIWDAEGLSSKLMTKAELAELTDFLDTLIRKAFHEKKENIKRYKLAIKKLEG